jgi:hypothetical protein
VTDVVEFVCGEGREVVDACERAGSSCQGEVEVACEQVGTIATLEAEWLNCLLFYGSF